MVEQEQPENLLAEQNGVQSVPVIQQMHTVANHMTSSGKEPQNQANESIGQGVVEELQLLDNQRSALAGERFTSLKIISNIVYLTCGSLSKANESVIGLTPTQF